MNYEILRPCLWFAKGEVKSWFTLSKYYTNYAIESLIKYGFIKEIKK